MTHSILDLIQRYQSRGVLVDTNILLLLFLGRYDRSQIGQFKRTNQFTIEDFDSLVSFLSRFKTIVTTPNILTEVSNLAGQIGPYAKKDLFAEIGKTITILDEHYIASSDAVQLSPFSRLGLTDSAIMRLAKDKHLVLTSDLDLYVELERSGVAVLNFNHLRQAGLFRL